MLIWGDLIHNATLQFAHPDGSVAADVEPTLAVESRRLGLEWAADEMILVAGMHLPFPGIGRVERDPSAQYKFAPVQWTPKY